MAFDIPAYMQTGTGLDYLTEIITKDPGLAANIPVQDIWGGAIAAAGLNGLLVEAVDNTGVADDGVISADEIGVLDAYVGANWYDLFAALHGDDENGEETGFHLVQNDGATTQLYGENAVDTVADGLYHIGFGGDGTNLTNEDGNANATYTDAAQWMNNLLAEELAGDFFADKFVFIDEALQAKLQSKVDRWEAKIDRLETRIENTDPDKVGDNGLNVVERLQDNIDRTTVRLENVYDRMEANTIKVDNFDLEAHLEGLPLEVIGVTIPEDMFA